MSTPPIQTKNQVSCAQDPQGEIPVTKAIRKTFDKALGENALASKFIGGTIERFPAKHQHQLFAVTSPEVVLKSDPGRSRVHTNDMAVFHHQPIPGTSMFRSMSATTSMLMRCRNHAPTNAKAQWECTPDLSQGRPVVDVFADNQVVATLALALFGRQKIPGIDTSANSQAISAARALRTQMQLPALCSLAPAK